MEKFTLSLSDNVDKDIIHVTDQTAITSIALVLNQILDGCCYLKKLRLAFPENVKKIPDTSEPRFNCEKHVLLQELDLSQCGSFSKMMTFFGTHSATVQILFL